MALSVLVALMMLAVPLASSSNLFVDGGQTNSNGDAPVLGASTGYTVTFQLNADGKSLDQNNVDNIISTLDTLSDKVTWYVNENDDLCALIIGDVSIQALIGALFDASGSKISKGEAYKLLSWKDAATGEFYDNSILGNDPVEKDMIFEAQWELQSGYVEVPVTVNFDGDVKEYVKAYKVTDGKIAVDDINSSDLPAAVEKVGKLKTTGYLINGDKGADKPVYSEGKVTYADGKELPGTGKTIPSTSSLTVTYTFNEAKYSKIIVHSEAFKDGKDVILYVDDAETYTYDDIFEALGSNGVNAINANQISGSVNYKTADGKYLLSGWNNGEALLNAKINTTATEFTLDAKLNGYNVVFMVNGQYEVKFVEFGKLSEDLCTLDTSGLNHWVWIPFNDVTADKTAGLDQMTGLKGTLADIDSADFQSFKFSSKSNIDLVEKVAASVNNADVPSVVFVACFEASADTAYAIFDANSEDITGYFGDNENIDRIVMTGKGSSDADKSTINKPISNPVYDENKVFIGYNGFSSDSKYGNAGSVTPFNSIVKSYDHIITFYVNNEISVIVYYKGTLTSSGINGTNQLVAFEYDGKIYDTDKAVTDKALEALNPKKDGYNFIQWNDVDGKKVFSDIVLNSDKKISVKTGDGFPKDGIKTDFNVYAQFDAKSYTIKYVNTFGGEQNQIAYVDQNTTLYGTGTFIHEGYDLKAWSTVPGNSGDKYDLGATFILNGADFEKLAGPDGKVVEIELYSVWEYNGGSDVPGGNTGGDSNDNTALYLIAGMLAVIAILAIVGIVLMRKK